ncbi:DinB family protein, partial [Kibdelosporangium lantanae]
MTSAQLLVDAFDRVREVVHEAVDGLTPEQLSFRVDEDANSIAWLVWHLTRVQDDHVAEVAGLLGEDRL